MSDPTVAGPEYRPLVSVIIPVYNRAHYVTQAVDSVLAQTYANIEIVVVNDGSKDNTLEVLKPYEDRIRVITQENAGLSAARNRGIRESSGELIAFLDDDDRWLPHKLETQTPLFADPKVNLVHTAQRFFTDDGGWDNVQFMGDMDYHELLSLKVINVQTVVVRRSVLDEVGLFDETLRRVEDWDMWLRVAVKYRLTGIDVCTSEARCHLSSLQHTNLALVFTTSMNVLKRHSRHHGDCALCRAAVRQSRQQLREYYYQQCKKMAKSALQEKLYLKAVKLRLQAFRYDPMALPRLPYNTARKVLSRFARPG